MKKFKVLLIDDDVEVLKVLQMGLEDSDLETIIAGSFAEARTLLRERHFDLVVCDVLMPGETGPEFHERMSLTHKNLPRFLFSSGLPKSSLTFPYPPGVAGLLMKPFTIKEFVEVVHSHLRKSVEQSSLVSIS
ncbi:MAG: response regulator [Bacteriovoracaceae bacterium]